MSLNVKRRTVVALVLVFAIWPAMHHALVLRYEFDAWLFFGWSMYATPNALVEVEIGQVRDGRVGPLALSADERERARHFAGRRAELGRLLSPSELGFSVLRARPGLEGVVIRLRRWTLRPGSAMVEATVSTHGYRPRAEDGP